MARRRTHGGGWPAIWYTFRKAREAGGIWRMYRALRSRNACKTCALGMGGQRGGMVNETGRGFEVCKKSVQAMAADMQGGLRPDFFEQFDFEKLKGFSARELEAAGRITTPLRAGPLDLTYQPTDYDAAIERLATVLRDTPPDETFFYFSGRSSNEAAFLLQLLARMYGTNNVNNCSYYCHQASGVGLASVTGSGTATITLEDVEHCDLIFLIGANPASNHPRFMKNLVECRRRGGTVIVVNPLREVGLEKFAIPSDWRSMLRASVIADEYVQPQIGSDIALLTGIAKVVLERGGVDEEFVTTRCDGWTAWRAQVERTTWDEIVSATGIEQATIERLGAAYLKSDKTIFCWAMGITHHEHGVENVQAIANLAMMRGMLGKPHAGLLPLRGHSNVQGVGSMGVTPKLKQHIFDALERTQQVTLPTTPGLDTLACMHAAAEGKIRVAVCLGGNLFASNPDLAFASRALNNIDLVVYISTTLNVGHVLGRGRETLVLPVLARDEEKQPTSQESMFNYVRLSDGGPARFEGLWSEVEVFAALADRLFDASPVDWAALREHRNIRRLIAETVPGYDALARIDDEDRGGEFQIEGRTFHAPQFNTPTTRAQFHAVAIPETTPLRDDELRLMTMRSEGQFNTVVYEEHDLYRNQDRRDVILMNRADMDRMGLAADRLVEVSTDTGAIRVYPRPFDVPRGNAAMYYPEANVFVPRMADAQSKTPAFKNIVVRVKTP